MNIEQITQIAVSALEEIKGVDIVTIDTASQTPLFSKIIVCSGNSNRQVKSLAQNVQEQLSLNNIAIIGVEGESSGEWVLVDSGDIVIHVMLPAVRAYYDLENLWNKAIG